MMFMLSASLLWPDTFASLNTRVTYSFCICDNGRKLVSI